MIKTEVNKKYLWLIVFPILFMVLGQILSKAVSLSNYNNLFYRFTDYRFVIACLLLIFHGFIWLYILKKLPLSFAYPLMSASYPIILLFSYLFFGEFASVNKMLGSLLIMTGVIIVGLEK